MALLLLQLGDLMREAMETEGKHKHSHRGVPQASWSTPIGALSKAPQIPMAFRDSRNLFQVGLVSGISSM